MEPKTDRELLAIMNVKLSYLCKELKEFKETAMSEQGFPRCAAHHQQLQDLDKSVTWIKRIMIAAVGIPVIGGIVAKVLPQI